MIPKTSFLEGFSNEGQIKKLWAKALNEANPEISLNQLREVRRRLLEYPAEYLHLWLPFIDSFFDVARIYKLSNFDVLGIEEMGNVLASVIASGQVSGQVSGQASGKSNGVAPSLRPEEVWFRVLNAHMVRSQEPLIRALLARIYFSRTASWEEKTRCVRELAGRRDIGELAAKVYIDYLQRTNNPGAEGKIIELLSEICAVDFTTEQSGLERACKVAQALASSKLTIPIVGLWNALGLYSLLVQRTPDRALPYFGQALQMSPQDSTALIGTLACRIRMGQYRAVSEMARQPLMASFARDPVVAGLLQLSSLLDWLDNQDVAGAQPGSVEAVEGLRNLGLRTYTGDLLDATLGRLYLLAGDAQRALALLFPLLGTKPQSPRRAYYTAWAALLTGNREAVAHCFTSTSHWPGRWTLACLLIDADPALAEKQGAFSFLRGILSSPSQIKPGYLPLIQARLAMAQSREPALATWNKESGSTEEDLEALRTVIGYLYYSHNWEALERWLTHPLFKRLPLADQLLWFGLSQLHSKSQAQQGLALLAEAATRHKYYRAALALTLHYLEKRQVREAKHYLHLVATLRNDSRVAFLRAYIAGREGQTDSAITYLEQVSSERDIESGIQAKILFAAGNLLLQKSCEAALAGQPGDTQRYRAQAAERLGSALQVDGERLPAHAAALWSSAQFIAHPDQQKLLGATLWDDLERLDAAQRQPWLKWNAIVGRLWYGSPDQVMEVAGELHPIIDETQRIKSAVVEAFALALVAVSRRSEQAEHLEQVLRLLERGRSISTSNPFNAVKQACEAGITLTLREQYKKADTQQRYQVRQELMRLYSNTTSGANEMLALLLATASVENGARLAAINTLRDAQSQQGRLQRLFPYLAELLEQPGQITHAAPEPEPGSSAAVQRAYQVLSVAEAFSSNQPERGYDMLNQLLLQHGTELTALVKVGRILPHLCAYAMQAGGAVPSVITETVRSFTSAPMENEQRVMLARCAAAVGELTLAESLWERAIQHDRGSSEDARKEYARLLCHRATNAHMAGNIRETIRNLRQAASYLQQEA